LGCVAKRLRSGKIVFVLSGVSHRHLFMNQVPVQVASFSIRHHLVVRPVVSALSPELPQLGEMMLERGLTVDHTTVYRARSGLCSWTNELCPHWRPTNDSWRVDETYISVKGGGSISTGLWMSVGNTLVYALVPKRCTCGRTLFPQSLNAEHNQVPAS